MCMLLAAALLAAWQTSQSRRERQDVISWISKKVHEITEVEYHVHFGGVEKALDDF